MNEESLTRAAQMLRAGDVVAFPTETVYGLGANALDGDAVKKIYRAKGRPAHNPLIVHVTSIDQARELVADWPQQAEKLAAAFWPGPISLVLRRNPARQIPDIVTAGGDTIAIRLPQHPVARKLIELSGCPLAAPSANASNRISPTQANHVLASLGGRIPLVLDGGGTNAGIESTVVDLTGDVARILRPGSVTALDIRKVLDAKVTEKASDKRPETLKSPGQLEVHYAPVTPLWLFGYGDIDGIRSGIEQLSAQGKVAIVAISESVNSACGITVAMPADASGYARELYRVLHDLDSRGLTTILWELPPDDTEWTGVRDRLSRAGKPFV